MLSRNLVKQVFTVVQPDEKRVIDSNGLLQQRLEEFEERNRAAKGGFVSGLAAEQIDLPPEAGVEDEEEPAGNVIKAQEDAGQILAEARREAESVIAEAKAEAMRVCEEAKTQAEVEKNRIMADAKQQGYSEGLAQAQAESTAAKQEYLERERQLEAFYQQQVDELEPQLVDLITDIYQHIFHVELKSYREILAHLISSTLRKIDGGHDFMVHVSKEDYPYVNMQKKQIMAGAVSANCNVEVVEDLTLAKNECLIEAESGIFDCGLGTQLSELKQKLMLLSWSKED